MRRARLRRSGCRAVLPWKALAARGVGVTRDVLVSGSDGKNYAYSTTAMQRCCYARSKVARRRLGLLVSYTASLGLVFQCERSLLNVRRQERNPFAASSRSRCDYIPFFGADGAQLYRAHSALFVALTSSLLIYHIYTEVAVLVCDAPCSRSSKHSPCRRHCATQQRANAAALQWKQWSKHANAAEQAQHQPCDSAAGRRASSGAATCSS